MQEHIFESASTPGTFYKVLEHEDGDIDCNCRGYIFCRKSPRACTHTKQVAAKRAAAERPTLELAIEGRSAHVVNPHAGYIQPMLASPLEGKRIEDFSAAEWWLEEKFDGHRVIVNVSVEGANFVVRAWSRPRAGSKDGLPRKLPQHIADVLQFFPPGTYDGELVMPGGNSWNVVDTARQHELRFIVFDVLHLPGQDDLMEAPAWHRAEYLLALKRGIRETGETCVDVSRQMAPTREAVEAIWKRGGEGAILKRRAGIYRPGARSKDWIKVKKVETAVMTVIGYEAGLLGPFSCVRLRDDAGIESTVKTKDNDWLRELAANPTAYIGRRLQIEHQGMFKGPKGTKPRHPMWDHFIEDGE